MFDEKRPNGPLFRFRRARRGRVERIGARRSKPPHAYLVARFLRYRALPGGSTMSKLPALPQSAATVRAAARAALTCAASQADAGGQSVGPGRRRIAGR